MMFYGLKIQGYCIELSSSLQFLITYMEEVLHYINIMQT